MRKPKNIIRRSSIEINESYEAEPLVYVLQKATAGGKDPTEQGSVPIIYTEKKDGVLPGYDIRTDRFEVAREALEKIAKSKLAKRSETVETVEDPNGSSSDGAVV